MYKFTQFFRCPGTESSRYHNTAQYSSILNDALVTYLHNLYDLVSALSFNICKLYNYVSA